jgi:hypothetical protein
MEASGQLHIPAALPPGKELPVPIREEAGWALEPVWMLWRKEKSVSCWKSNPGLPACSPLLYRLSYADSCVYLVADNVISPPIQFAYVRKCEISSLGVELHRREGKRDVQKIFFLHMR